VLSDRADELYLLITSFSLIGEAISLFSTKEKSRNMVVFLVLSFEIRKLIPFVMALTFVYKSTLLELCRCS
jgi:hypothetical protein